MRLLYWLGVVGLALLPFNFLITIVFKLSSGIALGAEDIILFAAGIFGVVAAVITYRLLMSK